MLKRKQNTYNQDWIDVLKNIKSTKEYDEVDILAQNTVRHIRNLVRITKGNIAFAWSGGKDSLVIADLCKMAGIQKSVFVTTKDLDYPVFLHWVNIYKPNNCTIIDVGLGLDFLIRNPKMLFPTKDVLPKWYNIIQHKGQRKYYKENNLSALIFGRRKQDGNYIRGSYQNCFHTISNNQNIYCPIADWNHEHILSFIVKNNLQLPPIYNFPDGWRQGTHLWPCRLNLGSVENNWSELYSFAPDVVEFAATKLDSAKSFLSSI